MKVKFSIRYKILSVVTVLLVAAIGFYLLLATQIFRQDKTELVFDLNRSLVSTLATEVDTSLRGAADKLKLYALLSAQKSGHPATHADRVKLFEQIMQNDPLLVRAELYERSFDGTLKLVSKVTDKNFQKLYLLDDNFFSQTLVAQKPIPFDKIQSASKFVWNASLAKKPPLIGLGIAVVQEGENLRPEKMMAVVGYLKSDSFLKSLRTSTLTQAFVVDGAGRVLLHGDESAMVKAEDLSRSPIVDQLSKNQVSSGVLEYSVDQKSYLGAFAKTGFAGAGVVSQVDSEKAFMAVNHLVRRSFIFALLVSTITFIATIFFSRTLTRPLQNLLSAMQKVSEGDLDAELNIKSHDEISVLSNSFNQMTTDLKSSRYQLEEINRELENKVIDRTKKLEEQNRAVKEAQEALLRTTRLASVGEVAGRAAHEVLNPLTSIMARIQKVQKRLTEEIMNDKNLLGEIVGAWRSDFNTKGFDGFLKSLNEPSSVMPGKTLLQEDLANIDEIFKRWDGGINTLETDTQFLLQQATRIEKILGSMRSLSNVSGQRAQFQIHEVLHDAINIVGDLCSRHKVKVTEKYNAEQDRVWVDRDELIQVLTNLFNNALQAIAAQNSSGGEITVETKNEKQKIIIDITDNGTGIKSEHQGKLFESHFSTKSPESGTGLGLSISRRFVRAFNGDLYLVSSKPGVATCFRIELPLNVKNQEAAA